MTPAEDVALRALAPADFAEVIGHIDEWWGGRPMTALLPRLFFDHFYDTSLIAADTDGRIAGFLIGFLSPAVPEVAYVHFVGVDPARRGHGLGRRLHARFAEIAQAAGRSRVRAITAPVNAVSIAFHTSLGFSSTLGLDHDGPGHDRVIFERVLD